jgi:hypothetical protein
MPYKGLNGCFNVKWIYLLCNMLVYTQETMLFICENYL